MCEAHCPTGGEEILCLWASCDALKRRRFSLMTHLYDRHCNAEVCIDIVLKKKEKEKKRGEKKRKEKKS